MSFEAVLRRRQHQFEQRRGLAALLVGGLIALTFLTIGLMVIWPGKPDGGASWTNVGHISDYEIGKPVYFSEGDFWLTRVSEDEVVALVPKESWYFSGSRCQEAYSIQTRTNFVVTSKARGVAWMPNYRFNG